MQSPFLVFDNSPSPSEGKTTSKWRQKILKSKKSTPPKSYYDVETSSFKRISYNPKSSSPINMSASPTPTPTPTPTPGHHHHYNPYNFPSSVSSQSSSSRTSSSLDLVSTPPPREHSNHWNFITPITEPDTLRTSVFESPLFFKGKSDQIISPTPIHPKHSFAPKVKPYITTQMGVNSSPPRKSDRCTICEELMQTRLESERPLTLTCGDLVHEECFQVTLEYEIERLFEKQIINDESTVDEVQHNIYFQYCKGHNCQKKQSKLQLIPQDKSLFNDKVYQVLSIMKAKSPNKKNNNIKALNSTLRGSKIQAKDFFDPKIIHSPIPIKANDAPGRYSVFNSIASPSRSPSPTISISTINTASITIPAHIHSTPDQLRNYFIRYLLDACPTFSLSNLLKLGPLRLVDKLQVSFSTNPQFNFESKIVYLFENYILLWVENSTSILFATDNLQIDTTPSPSILKIKVKNNQNSVISELSLSSDTSSIIEKWVIAVSDLKFTFPSEIFSSTMSMPQKTLDPKIVTTTTTSAAVLSPPVQLESFHNTNAFDVDADVEDEGSDDDSDIDSDDEIIKNALHNTNSLLSINSKKIDKLFSIQNDDDDESDYDESDEDSDKEKINAYLNNSGWNEIIAHIDSALSNNKHY
ncbi:hypothetical protein DFJ63DRAFT_315174 [Scheffersomyces coipomensis]|uniref:uncharacterized protein n=1 Tax=Scheffersomyces coipomensis TaxID=1788519 RepID=UPI00315CCD62